MMKSKKNTFIDKATAYNCHVDKQPGTPPGNEVAVISGLIMKRSLADTAFFLSKQ